MICFQDCKTKVHSVCENHNGIWKNCVDQPRWETNTFGRPISLHVHCSGRSVQRDRSQRRYRNAQRWELIEFGFHLMIGQSSAMYCICKGQILMTQKSELSHFQLPSWIHETYVGFREASKESKTQNVSTSGTNQLKTQKECWWSVTSGQDELFGASDDIKEADGLVPLICLPNAISTPRIKCSNIGWSFLQIPYHWF